jgi:VIT1/CCC1 family predicted Fe2+/Mn2+ transporter
MGLADETKEAKTMYWIMSILGLVLFIAPFVFGFSANTAAMWACIILGLVVALSAGYKAIAQDKAKWQVVLILIAGILAVINPFILGYNTNAGGMWTSIIMGVVMVILAGKEIHIHRTV